LQCAAGNSNTVVAQQLRITKQTVANGAGGLWSAGLMDCFMNRDPGRRAKWVTRRLNE
jgi:hypothetical protein